MTSNTFEVHGIKYSLDDILLDASVCDMQACVFTFYRAIIPRS